MWTWKKVYISWNYWLKFAVVLKNYLELVHETKLKSSMNALNDDKTSDKILAKGAVTKNKKY